MVEKAQSFANFKSITKWSEYSKVSIDPQLSVPLRNPAFDDLLLILVDKIRYQIKMPWSNWQRE